MNLKDEFIEYILSICKRDEIKTEFIELTKPIINSLLREIYPYLFIVLIFLFSMIIMNIFTIFVLFHKHYKKT